MDTLQRVLEAIKDYYPELLALGFILYAPKYYIVTRDDSGTKGLKCYLGHFAIIVMGWLMGEWLGLLVISLPLLLFYYYFLFQFAMVVVPISDPDDWNEWWKRFRILLWYRWGVQFPIWIVTESTGSQIEKRIPGNQFGSHPPGLVLARPYQVVSLTTGIAFSGIRKPGTVFTRPYESPFSVIDLRTQLRTSWIDVVSSDGISYKALLFTSFAVDKEKWDRKSYHDLYQRNHQLKDGRDLDYKKGSYPFSRARICALLSTTGVSSTTDELTNTKIAYWDERVLYEIEKTAREVLSQRQLDTLWRHESDSEGTNAVDAISSTIMELCSFELKLRGVHLYTCRIVDFNFAQSTHETTDGRLIIKAENKESKLNGGKDFGGDVERKQIATWGAEWQREAEKTRSKGKAEADVLMQEARAYAYTSLLTAVAEGLQEARLLHPHLPRYVIAVRFISALEKITKEHPEVEETREMRESLNSF